MENLFYNLEVCGILFSRELKLQGLESFPTGGRGWTFAAAVRKFLVNELTRSHLDPKP